MIMSNLKKNGIKTSEKVIEGVYGSSSWIAACFVSSSLGFYKKEYHGFMSTFFYSCRMKMSIKSMEDKALITWSGVSASEYKLLWKAVDGKKKSSQSREMQEDLEHAVNETLRAIVLPEDSLFQLWIAMDDDKVYFCIIKGIKRGSKTTSQAVEQAKPAK